MSLVIQVPSSTSTQLSVLSGLTAGGRNRQKRRQTGMSVLSRASARKQSGIRPEKLAATDRSLRSSQVPYRHDFKKIDLVKAQVICLKFHQTFSYAVVHFGDIPAERNAGVVGHDQTILCERRSEVALHAPAIQADFRASGDRLLDQDQQQVRLDLFRNVLTENSLKKNCFSIEKRVRKWMHAQWSCTVNKETLTPQSS